MPEKQKKKLDLCQTHKAEYVAPSHPRSGNSPIHAECLPHACGPSSAILCVKSLFAQIQLLN